MKFRIDELELALKHHKLKISNAHGRLVSSFTFNVVSYGFIILILIYSFLYIVVASVDPQTYTESSVADKNTVVYMKYLILSVMGLMFYYVTNYLVKFSEIFTRFFVACSIPILLLGVVFTLEDGDLSFSGSQSVLFLLGYNTNLVISVLKIGNDKIKAAIEGNKSEPI